LRLKTGKALFPDAKRRFNRREIRLGYRWSPGKLAGRRMNWMLLMAALACAGFVQGLSGFGFGLVSMSLLPLFMNVKQAAVISTPFSLLATVTVFARHWREFDRRSGLAFILSLCAGLPAGVLFLEHGSEMMLIRVLGGLMLAYAAREFFVRAAPRSFPAFWTIPMGLFSGAMSGAFNLGGVPTAAYAYAHPWSRGQIMAFLQVTITLSCALRMIFYHQAGLLAGIPWTRAAALALPLYGAIWLGHLTLQRIHPAHMRKGIFIFIGLSGFYYLFVR
jgi:uncharacterized membrane protein YfcA